MGFYTPCSRSIVSAGGLLCLLNSFLTGTLAKTCSICHVRFERIFGRLFLETRCTTDFRYNCLHGRSWMKVTNTGVAVTWRYFPYTFPTETCQRGPLRVMKKFFFPRNITTPKLLFSPEHFGYKKLHSSEITRKSDRLGSENHFVSWKE